MFDLDGETLWMGPKPPKRKKRSSYRQEQPLFGDYGASNYDYDDYEPRPRYRQTRPRYYKSRSTRPAYRKKQKPVNYGKYAKDAYKGSKVAFKGAKTTYRGAKKTYKGISKFVSKVGKPKTMQSRSWKDKLFRGGSIYKKEK